MSKKYKYLLFTLMAICAATYLDYAFMTNTKAKGLMILGTFIMCLYSYSSSKNACYKTVEEELDVIFSNNGWYWQEVKFAFQTLIIAVLFIGAIWLWRYLPNGYTINWFGVAAGLVMLMLVSVLSGFFGIMQGISRATN